MLPFGGQGSNSAIEDGGTLGYLFQDIQDTSAIPERLNMFERVRHSRATRVQILSSVRAGREKEVHEQLMQYADPAGSGESRLWLLQPLEDPFSADHVPDVPTNMAERTTHDYR